MVFWRKKKSRETPDAAMPEPCVPLKEGPCLDASEKDASSFAEAGDGSAISRGTGAAGANDGPPPHFREDPLQPAANLAGPSSGDDAFAFDASGMKDAALQQGAEQGTASSGRTARPAPPGESSFQERTGQEGLFPSAPMGIAEGRMEDADPFAETEKATAPPENCLPAEPEDPEVRRLRNLLFEREIALLNRLKSRLDNPVDHARDVSDVIAEALILRSSKDERLSRALEPVVDGILRRVMRKKPREFANIIFPMMGPAIRRSIAETFRNMLESFNKTLELSFSWKGLKWRFEAITSGKSFSEVVMLNTLVYRVEEIFFIHSDTGLPLARVTREGVEAQDGDLVSGMLTAVQQFVEDCFNRGTESELESVKWGDYTIMVEKNPFASLACVVYGQPPADFRQRLRENLEMLLIEYADELANFKGDTAPFQEAKDTLEESMTARFVDEDKPLPFYIRLLPWALALALLCGAGYYVYEGYRENRRVERHAASMSGAVDAIRSEPGYMLTNVVRKRTEPWEILCMKDGLARDIPEVLADAGIDPGAVVVKAVPFISLEPALVEERVSEKISPPATTSMRLLSNGTLQFNGTAPMNWILQARQEALALPGVKHVDMKGLSDPRMETLAELVRKVEGTIVEFPLGKDTPVPEDAAKLKEAVSTLVALEKLARDMGVNVGLTIYGHADAVGSATRNYEISQARVRTLAAMLYAQGSSIPVAMYGMGAEFAREESGEPGKGDQASRRIEMRVHLTQAGDATPEALKN